MQLKKFCVNLEQIKDCKRNKNEESRKLTKKKPFHQEYKILRELLNTPKFRSLTYIEDKEKNYGTIEKEKMDRHCIDIYGFIINPDETAKINSIRIIGN